MVKAVLLLGSSVHGMRKFGVSGILTQRKKADIITDTDSHENTYLYNKYPNHVIVKSPVNGTSIWSSSLETTLYIVLIRLKYVISCFPVSWNSLLSDCSRELNTLLKTLCSVQFVSSWVIPWGTHNALGSRLWSKLTWMSKLECEWMCKGREKQPLWNLSLSNFFFFCRYCLQPPVLSVWAVQMINNTLFSEKEKWQPKDWMLKPGWIL